MADNAKWYVVHTYSGYENAVKTAIEKFVANRHLEDMILDIQIPMETVTEVTESGAVNVRGVTGFVTSGSTKPTPLTEDEVLALGMERREIVVAYNVGDQVKITDGPLATFLGTVEEIEPEKNRVCVVVSMFGRETPVELELDQVEVVER